MKKKKKPLGPPKDGWLVTFSDLMTLLLTFFVLLLSMSSLEVEKVMEITIKSKDRGGQGSVRGKVATRVEMVQTILREEPEVIQPEELLRDIFFPDDYIPENLRQDFVRNVYIYKNEDGIVIMLSDKILFATGKATITFEAKMLLRSLVEVLQGLTSTFIISGFTDISGGEEKNYILSGDRALAVLEYFVSRGVQEEKFGISAYGEDRPLTSAIKEKVPAMERRIEILIKK